MSRKTNQKTIHISTTMKKNISILLFLFFLSNTIVFAQTYTKQQIDSLVSLGEKHIYNMDIKTKPLALEIIEQSRKAQYIRGIIDGYQLIIAYYCFLGEFKTAQEYIAIAEKELPEEKDSPSFIDIIRLKGDCYNRTGLFQRARKEFNRCLTIADKIQDKNIKHGIKANVYNSIAMTISKQDKTNDSLFYYYRKCISEFQQRTGQEEGKNRAIAQANINISTSFIQIKKYDSAAYYVQRALKILHKNDTSILKLNAYKNLGDIHLGKRRYDSAIYYYESILKKTEAANQSYILSNVYSKLSNIYSVLNDDKKSKAYQDQYITINKKISKLEEEALEASIESMGQKNKAELETSRTIFNIIIGFMILTFGTIAYHFIKKFRKVKADKKKKGELLYEKEEELERLTDSNKPTLQEVLQLAINKDPSFNTKFQELEPDFYDKLNQKANSALNYNDLIFCAMIRLGFITKEIAQNLNSTVGAVETRKYRLRKKLNLASSDEDLTIWMMNL
ncbi:tetratricopeptide repeat protein [Flavobacterium branchiarum]|uniref:HTH luxR-type domain-containing protein n=1 Tax=Flavobacterium branchiarum TaxID=1114870 RepID=A0ABV5FJ42_9FLAO|nr:tetratricopeptide repeat protein [Flavobacterium branchiarum]MDN3675628.1 tetratricopeptide repeat protein [Flavobacterium branchiarum]